MTLRLRSWFALLLVVCAMTSAWSQAPTTAPPPPNSAPPPAAPLPQDQLDALLAPIALYPDQLLSQVLMASTYPLDVVEAARFVQQNPGLKGDALDQALATKSWDPSVQSLAAFPQVLAMMNDKLDWTQQLGDAFLANEGQVMQTVQSLRGRAQAAGNLQSTPQQKVIVQNQAIMIEPAQPQVVYVPVYNPTVIYGPWWVPAYQPWFWYPPPIYGYPPLGPAFGVGFVWGTAWAISSNHWGWANPNWRGGNININVNHNNVFINNRPAYRNTVNNGNWQHYPEQRRGVAYRDTSVQNRYQHTNNAAVQSREAYRGRDVAGQAGAGMQRPNAGQAAAAAQRPTTFERPTSTGAASTMTRPSPGTANTVTRSSASNAQSFTGAAAQARPAPTFNANQSRPQTQQFSDRGAQSRATMNAAPARSAGGGGGGGAPRSAGSGGGARGGGGGGAGTRGR